MTIDDGERAFICLFDALGPTLMWFGFLFFSSSSLFVLWLRFERKMAGERWDAIGILPL